MRARFPFLLTLLALAGLSAVQADEKLGRLIVKVTEAGTGQPVAGADVHGYSDKLEPAPVHHTDASGRVEIPVALGHLQIRAPSPPLGYWIAPPVPGPANLDRVALTREQPTVERSYEVTREVLWPARAVTANGKPAEGVRLRPSFNSFRQGGYGATGQTDAAGKCQLTFPRSGGELWVSCSGAKSAVDFVSPRVQLDIDADFDPTQVASRSRAAEGDRFVLIDRQGRKASLAGCDAILREGAAELFFVVQDPSGPELMGEVVGRVLDEAGRPIVDATVMCNHDAATREDFSQRSAADGSFRFRAPFKWSRSSQQPAFMMMVQKDGFTCHEESHLFVPGEGGIFRLEPIVLKPGYPVAVRVLREDGQPAEGAWLRCNSGERFGDRSDREGVATVRNLPAGEVSILAQFGDRSGSAKVEVTPTAAAQPPVEIRLKLGAVGAFVPRPRPVLKPLAIGASALPWSIDRWIDGKEHTLQEFRGRVLVIQLGNLGSSLEILPPVSHNLQKRFPDVAFVYIQPAGTKPHIIKELLAANGWDFVVGFDKGTSGADSQTLLRYGGAGIIILDREGRVQMNSDLRGDRAAEEAKMKAIAAAAGLPWPIEKDASEEELIRRNRRYYEQWIGSEIEKALEK